MGNFPINQSPPCLIFDLFVGYFTGFVFASDGSESAQTAQNLPKEPGIEEKSPAGGKMEVDYSIESSRARGRLSQSDQLKCYDIV